MKVLVMPLERNRHPEGETLENYSMGTTSEEEAAQLEEHLLTCEVCRRRLNETEAFVLSMQRASTQLRTEQRREWRPWVLPRFAPILAAALAVLVIGIGLQVVEKSAAPPVAVILAATRGAAGAARAPEARPLLLRPDLEGLPALSSYRLEMVDHVGNRKWQGTVGPSLENRSAVAPAARPGLYFVRVYSPSGELLREYALEIAPR